MVAASFNASSSGNETLVVDQHDYYKTSVLRGQNAGAYWIDLDNYGEHVVNFGVKYGELWWTMVNYGELLWSMVNHGEFGEVWWVMVNYSEIWWIMLANYGKWQMANYGKLQYDFFGMQHKKPTYLRSRALYQDADYTIG